MRKDVMIVCQYCETPLDDPDSLCCTDSEKAFIQEVLNRLCGYIFEVDDTGLYVSGNFQDVNIEEMLPDINYALEL